MVLPKLILKKIKKIKNSANFVLYVIAYESQFWNENARIWKKCLMFMCVLMLIPVCCDVVTLWRWSINRQGPWVMKVHPSRASTVLSWQVSMPRAQWAPTQLDRELSQSLASLTHDRQGAYGCMLTLPSWEQHANWQGAAIHCLTSSQLENKTFDKQCQRSSQVVPSVRVKYEQYAILLISLLFSH